MNSTRSIVTFILIMTSVVAIMLTGLREITKEQAEINEAVFNKRAILSSVDNYLDKRSKDMTDAEVLAEFDPSKMNQLVLDMNGEVIDGLKADDIKMEKEKKKPEAERRLPLYIYKSAKGTFYILSVRGKGLWDEIWGTIALKEDLTTVAGAAFDHKGETPGLGAEIKDNPVFAGNFANKKIYDDAGNYTSINVRKGGAKTIHQVDGITGATVTANGVSDMLNSGIKYYEPYLKTLK